MLSVILILGCLSVEMVEYLRPYSKKALPRKQKSRVLRLVIIPLPFFLVTNDFEFASNICKLKSLQPNFKN